MRRQSFAPQEPVLRKLPASSNAHIEAAKVRFTPDALRGLVAFCRAAGVYWRALVAAGLGLYAWWATGWMPLGILVLGVSWASILAAQVGSTPPGGSASPPTSTLTHIHTTLLTRDGLRAYMQGRRRIRKAKTLVPDALDAIGFPKIPGTRGYLQHVRATPTGVTGLVHVGNLGRSVEHLAAKTEQLADVIRCLEFAVRRETPGTARVNIHWVDPLADLLTLADMPQPRDGHLVYGVTANGQPATINYRLSMLLIGMTQHGKSNLVWSLIASLIGQRIPTRLYVSDPKGGVELDKLGRRLGKNTGPVKVHHYATNPAETEKLVENVERAMAARLAAMKKRGARKWQPTPDEPLAVLILDEFLALPKLITKGADSPLGRILFMGSAAGFVVWPLSQLAQVDTLGRIRDLIPQRIALATANPDVTDAALGQGAEAAGATCSDIHEPGVGYAYNEHLRGYTRFRAPMVSDEETRWIAAGRLPRTGPPAEDDGAEAVVHHIGDTPDPQQEAA